MTSLRARMLVVIVATIILCWIGAAAVLVTYFTHNLGSPWDSKLQAFATKIMLVLPATRPLTFSQPRGLELRSNALPEATELAFQIWSGNELRVRTPGAPASPLRPDFRDGFASVVVEDQRWRVYSASDKAGRIFVQVGNLHSVIDDELRNEAFVALAINTLLLALVGALLWYAVRRWLRPIVAVEKALRSRKKFDLTPLPSSQLPLELRPLGESFNFLLEQLDEAVRSERRFIGDAAHELRTPLSALQAQAEIALRAATVAEKDVALVKLLAVARRSARLSEQMLDLARLDAGARASHQTHADLSELIVHVVQELEVYAQREARSIVLATTPCLIECDVDEIGILLRNLLDNALRYTHTGGRVRIGCWQVGAPGDRRVCLEVADDGPGVPEAQRRAIFNRFHRVAGSVGRGSGIGLSLVARIAHLHGATIETALGLDARGFCVRVLFPLLAHGAATHASMPQENDIEEGSEAENSSAGLHRRS
jgi:signal transduction histidine kinase